MNALGRAVLVLGQGHSTLRVVRACHDLGLRTIVFYPDSEINALYVRTASEAYALGDAHSSDSDYILALASRCRAGAIHPAGDPLGADPNFARRVAHSGRQWLGLSDTTLEWANPASRVTLAAAADVPVDATFNGPVRRVGDIEAFVAQEGLPVELSSGGSSRSIHSLEEIADVFDTFPVDARTSLILRVQRPSGRRFRVYCSRTAAGETHILGLAEASIVRRGEPLIVESPPPQLEENSALKMRAGSERIARQIELVGIATVVFDLGSDGEITFQEVVPSVTDSPAAVEDSEHRDLIKTQVLMGLGRDAPVAPAMWARHAISFRICAEDPGLGFIPSAGVISRFEIPSGPGVRIDEAVEVGSAAGRAGGVLLTMTVSGNTRSVVLERARRAFSELRIEGVATTAAWHRALLRSSAFESHPSSITTAWLASGAVPCDPAPRVYSAVPARTVVRWPIEVAGRAMVLVLPLGDHDVEGTGQTDT